MSNSTVYSASPNLLDGSTSLLYDNLPMLRVLTCGSVDDGKSTLLGRLLHDTGSVPRDVVTAVGLTDEKLALLFDGLEAEQEQGVTIDVTHRTFVTPRRRFRLLDAPGHEQYTRNMATAASGADIAIVLVNVEHGILAQTKRHAAISSLFGIRHVVLAVNKMDRIGFQADRFNNIVHEFLDFSSRLDFVSIAPFPVSGLRGDNVVHVSSMTSWWDGGAILPYLESLTVLDPASARPLRLPLQLVTRLDVGRIYAGTIMSGQLAAGDEVVVTPSGRIAHVETLRDVDGPVTTARAGDAVTITVKEDVDISRGDVISAVSKPPTIATSFKAQVIWLSEEALRARHSYLLQVGTSAVPAVIGSIEDHLDIETLQRAPDTELQQNEIGTCVINTYASVSIDPFTDNPYLGSFILIDRQTFATVGAGVIHHDLPTERSIHVQTLSIGKNLRAERKCQRPVILWFTGLSGAGKSTVADVVEERLFALGHHTMLLDGDNIRQGLNRDLGFNEPDRVENIRRVAEVAKLFLEAGLIVICSFISPFRSERDSARALVGPEEFLEIFVDATLEECIRRDPKGLYKRAIAGEIANFTGISAAYERPLHPELHLDTAFSRPDDLAAKVVLDLQRRGVI